MNVIVGDYTPACTAIETWLEANHWASEEQEITDTTDGIVRQSPIVQKQQQQYPAGYIDTNLPQSTIWQPHQQYPAGYISFSQQAHQDPPSQLPYTAQYAANPLMADADSVTAAPKKHAGGRPKGSRDKKKRAPKGQGSRHSIADRKPGRPKGSKNKPKTTAQGL